MTEAHRKQQVGHRLRLIREALGFGLREFARKHRIDHTKLNHWEKGRHYPDQAFIRVLWDEHGVTADWVYLERKGGLPRDLADNLDRVEAAFSRASAEADHLGPDTSQSTSAAVSSSSSRTIRERTGNKKAKMPKPVVDNVDG